MQTATKTAALPLTIEQEKALANTDFARRMKRRQSVYIAYAGTGKTFIILRTAERLDDEVLILAFNSAIIRDLQPKLRTLSKRVRGLTSHQLALRSLPEDFQQGVKASLEAHNGQIAVPQIVDALEIQDYEVQGIQWTSLQLGSLVKRTVARFCQSSDPQIIATHIPHAQHLPKSAIDQVIHESQRLWAAFESLRVPIPHDVYFKLWALGNPQLAEPYRLVDEAQDSNPALFGVLFAQKEGLNIWAGDPYQSIYSWRGAQNAIELATQRSDAISSRLTQSFRFGEETAEMASRLLQVIGETHPVHGTGSTKVQCAPEDIQPPDVAAKVHAPFAWIAFSNGALINAALSCVEAEIPFHIVGQGRDQLAILYSAMALKRGEINPGGPLGAYRYWSDLEDEAAEQPDGEAGRLVKLQRYPGLYDTAEALRKGTQQESAAQVILSTVHAAKGREWDLVVLDKDLDITRDKGDRRLYRRANGELHFDNREDVHLRYVAITRARKRLVMACRELYRWLTD